MNYIAIAIQFLPLLVRVVRAAQSLKNKSGEDRRKIVTECLLATEQALYAEAELEEQNKVA
jgi:hypothetical protein